MNSLVVVPQGGQSATTVVDAVAFDHAVMTIRGWSTCAAARQVIHVLQSAGVPSWRDARGILTENGRRLGSEKPATDPWLARLTRTLRAGGSGGCPS